MVTIPYLILQCGIVLGSIILIIISILSLISTRLLFVARGNCPERYESYYEIGYAVLGRWSIFMISGSIIIAQTGCLVFIYVVIGDIMATLGV
jgi:amino acid permease